MARFQILRHPTFPVLYVRFTGDVTGADFIAALNGTYASPLRQEGDASVWDLTDVGAVVVDLPEVHALNAQGQMLAQSQPPGLIVIVAPQPDVYALARLYGYHAARSGRIIEVVRSRTAAWRRLGVPEPDYGALRSLINPAPRYETNGAGRRA